jgi:branched-chain amino acid transport system permease protein
VNVTAQIAANVVVSAAGYALIGVSFAIPFRVARFFHMAHGAVYAWAAYFALVLAAGLHYPVWVAYIGAVCLSGILGALLQVGIYKPLRTRGTSSPLVLLLASLGVYVLLQNGISLAFGDAARTLPIHDVAPGIAVLGARVTPVQFSTIAASCAAVLAVAAILGNTARGKAMRAVMGDPELAAVCGIDSERVTLWAFAVGSALAGIAGVLAAADIGMTPTMGLGPLLVAVVVMVTGGVESTTGIAAASLLLALAQQLGAWFIGSRWQDPIAFAILLLFLLARPQGMLGRKLRKATV